LYNTHHLEMTWKDFYAGKTDSPFDPYSEIKASYMYHDGQVYRRLKNGEKKLIKKYTGTHGRGFYWTLNGMRQYEDWAIKYLQETPILLNNTY